MAIISNRVYRNREPRLAHKQDHKEYQYGNCPKCCASYALPEGAKLNCWTCESLALNGRTESDADRLHELLVTCDTDPAHIAIAESTLNLWQIGKAVIFGSAEWFAAVPEIKV